MKEILEQFPDAQFIEVEDHRIPVNLTPAADLTQPIKAAFPFPKGVVEMSGKDAATFLQGMCTLDVPKLEEGQGQRGLFVNKLGKILFEAFLIKKGDLIQLITDPSEEIRLAKHLDFFAITEDVTFSIKTDLEFYYLMEESSETQIPTDLSQIWSIKKDEGQIRVVSCVTGGNGFNSLLEAGFQMVGFEAYEELRPAFELSRAGIDFDSDRIPQEAALEDCVAFDKGCYLGQEPISRVAFRGQEKHKLVCFRSLNPVPSGLPIIAGDDEVGIVTSGSSIKVRGGFYSLGYLEGKWIGNSSIPLYCTTSELLVDREKDKAEGQ